LFQGFPNGRLLGSDNDAWVEDYSHAGGFRGLRWLKFLCPLPRNLDRDRSLGGFFFVRIGQRDALADAAAHRFGRMKDCHSASMRWRRANGST